MDFLALAQSRFSVRKFIDKPVEQEKIDLLLRAGQSAPTACNRQPQKIYVLQSAEALEKYRKCTVCHFNAPLAMLVCYDKNECWQREFDQKTSGDIDAAIVGTHIMLEAAALGLGCTWVMYFIPEAVQTEFHLPENEVPVCLLALGYPASDAAPAPQHEKRKMLDETVKFL